MSEIGLCTDCLGEGSVECPECWGAGRVKCEGCEGEGTREQPKRVTVSTWTDRVDYQHNTQMKGIQTDAP